MKRGDRCVAPVNRAAFHAGSLVRRPRVAYAEECQCDGASDSRKKAQGKEEGKPTNP